MTTRKPHFSRCIYYYRSKVPHLQRQPSLHYGNNLSCKTYFVPSVRSRKYARHKIKNNPSSICSFFVKFFKPLHFLFPFLQIFYTSAFSFSWCFSSEHPRMRRKFPVDLSVISAKFTWPGDDLRNDLCTWKKKNLKTFWKISSFPPSKKTGKNGRRGATLLNLTR